MMTGRDIWSRKTDTFSDKSQSISIGWKCHQFARTNQNYSTGWSSINSIQINEGTRKLWHQQIFAINQMFLLPPPVNTYPHTEIEHRINKCRSENRFRQNVLKISLKSPKFVVLQWKDSQITYFYSQFE